jgi:hypothetical protein
MASMIVTAIVFLSGAALLCSNMDDWHYHCIISINNSSNPHELKNYQVFVKLSDSFKFSQAQSDGDDLRFTNWSGDMLPYWIESYDSLSEEAKIWVKVDSIPASDTTSIIMYYGNHQASISANNIALHTIRLYELVIEILGILR